MQTELTLSPEFITRPKPMAILLQWRWSQSWCKLKLHSFSIELRIIVILSFPL